MSTDLLYYIMDYSGRYYKVDKGDQLVVSSEEEATVFTFAQANSRICVGKKSSFYCMIPIEEETDEACEMQEEGVPEEMEAVFGKEEKKQYISPVKELTSEEFHEAIVKNTCTYDLSEMNWGEYLTHFTYVASAIDEYRDKLAQQHSDIEKKICDILHYIELCEVDDEEAVNLVELLAVCRENRRDIKDELMQIEYFQSNLGTSANIVKAKQALKSIQGLEKRKYKPRKYNELFENGTTREKHKVKSDINEADVVHEKKKVNYSIPTGNKEKGDEDIMKEERNVTPFDGKENNWLLFARQQAEFYRNAEQYIGNLRMAIREIDQEIEEILLETEDANCNVAQGYKVFKRLKELRLERKAKSQELDCLCVLTDYIDCKALADTCEENLTEIEEIMHEKKETETAVTQIAGNDSEQIHLVETIQDMVG